MGTSLLELLPKTNLDCKYPMLAAFVNNRIKELNYKIYKPLTLQQYLLSYIKPSETSTAHVNSTYATRWGTDSIANLRMERCWILFRLRPCADRCNSSSRLATPSIAKNYSPRRLRRYTESMVLRIRSHYLTHKNAFTATSIAWPIWWDIFTGHLLPIRDIFTYLILENTIMDSISLCLRRTTLRLSI